MPAASPTGIVTAPETFDRLTLALPAQELLYREALLLDKLDFRGWHELFADDCYYWMPLSADAVEPTSGLNLIYADRQLMADRIFRVETREAYGQDPLSRTVHHLGNVFVTDIDADRRTATVSSTFALCELRRDVRWYAGRYVHLLRDDGGQLRIAFKKVELLECEQPLPNLTLFI